MIQGELEPWKDSVNGDGKSRAVRSLSAVLKNEEYLKSTLEYPMTWGEWEWNHACPPPDPQRYKSDQGILISFPFNRDYTVLSSNAFETFRTPAGLAAIRHYPLNEKIMPENILGYFCADMELSGPHCLRQEALAVAYGDPNYLASLNGMSLAYGFPEYARAFYQAFLSLPALPSKILTGLTQHPEIIIRSIETPKNTVYLAVVNTDVKAISKVKINLPPDLKGLKNAGTGETLLFKDGVVELDLEASSLTALFATK